jgi:ISXO2-like transposase domain
MIAWVSRRGSVVVQVVKGFPVKTVWKAADLAVHTGSRLSTDPASRYRALKAYRPAFVTPTQKE